MKKTIAVIIIVQAMVLPTVSANALSFTQNRLDIIGYAGSFPSQPYGLFFCRTHSKNIHLYGDFSMGLESHPTVGRPDEAVRCVPSDEDDDYYSFHLGITKSISPSSAFFFAVGLSRQKHYHQSRCLDDQDMETGKVWLLHWDHNEVKFDAVMGLFIPLKGRFILKIGVNHKPRGFNVGLGGILSAK